MLKSNTAYNSRERHLDEGKWTLEEALARLVCYAESREITIFGPQRYMEPTYSENHNDRDARILVGSDAINPEKISEAIKELYSSLGVPVGEMTLRILAADPEEEND